MCDVALITLYAKHMCHIILSSLTCLSLTCLSTLSHKWNDFKKKKKVIGHKMCVWIFCAPLSETFLILRRIEQDIIINAHTFHAKYPLFLSDFNQTGIF